MGCRRAVNPPTLLLLFLLGLPILAHFVPRAELIRGPWSLLGSLPIAAGLILNLAADRLFKEHKTSVKPHARPRSLVTNGPFRVSRNPMYLGFGLIICGVAIMLGSAIPLLCATTFFPLAGHLFIRPEEARLQAIFGTTWLDYRARVRRWI